MRRALVLAATVLCALVAAAVAAAAPPTITKVSHEPSVYTLTPADTGCAFDIQVNGYDDVVVQDFYDKDGNLVREVVHDDFVGTESANGVTLASTEHATITDDYVTGTETWTGQPLKLSRPGGGTITLDAGKLVYGPDGSVTVEHGPHPYADGDVAAYCGAFS